MEKRPVRSLVIVQARDDGNLVQKVHVWDWGPKQQAFFEKAKYSGSRRKLWASPRQHYHLSKSVSVTLEGVGRALWQRENPWDSGPSSGRGQKPDISPETTASSSVHRAPQGRASYEDTACPAKNVPSYRGSGGNMLQ